MNVASTIIKMEDDGRFNTLLSTLDIKEVCLTQCSLCNPFIIKDPSNMYRCYVAGSCIGATLNPSLIVYMLHKADIITARQVQIYHSP